MTENHPLLLTQAQEFAKNLINAKVSKSVTFHTVQHTQEVVAACELIASSMQLSVEDHEALIIAAWFHDTGYSSGIAKNHESVSIQIATDFLKDHQASETLINKVVGCINATRMPQNPTTLIEQILCDADLSHLGMDSFREKSRLLREELQMFGNENLSKKEWKQNNIAFLVAHKYFTPYAQENFQPFKDQHLADLKNKKNDDKMAKSDKKNKETKDKVRPPEVSELSVADPKAKKSKDNQTERGISTVFRIMAQTQNNLSQMADSKANILISVNAIILSIIISTLVTELVKHPNLLIPVIVLVTVCVTVIVFSILATRPNVNQGTFTQEDIMNKKTNLLFFGNFYRMTLPDYDWAMNEMLNDKNYLYSSIVKDNYFLGVVLAKKYRFLRIAYNIFMFGLIIAILAFALAFMIPPPVEVYVPGK